MIQFNECSFRYKGGRRNALDGITLNIGEGEFVGVTGASGPANPPSPTRSAGSYPTTSPATFTGR